MFLQTISKYNKLLSAISVIIVLCTIKQQNQRNKYFLDILHRDPYFVPDSFTNLQLENFSAT